MSDLVSMRMMAGIAVITIDNPPVNALKHEVRVGLLDHVARATGDESIDAIILICSGRTFVAGADINEFGKPPQPPILIEIIAVLEASRKPVIAAMHGNALGGGLELALGCHFRIATATTRLGLPEIKLGLIPGAGGTQRLPRLVGIERAITMILTGEPITGREALDAGLVDEVADGDLGSAALTLARRVLAEQHPLVPVRNRDQKLAHDPADLARFDQAAAQFTRRSKGERAPAAAVEALRGALTLPVAQALQRERALFLDLVGGEQSKARRHLFFAEREAVKVPDIVATRPRDVTRVAVIGAGTMGSGIAMCFAGAGIPVTVVETNAQALERGLDAIAANYRRSTARGALSDGEMRARLARIDGATDIAAATDADLVIEAVFEDAAVKRDVFAALGQVASAEAVLATNTSYLDIDMLARASGRPQAVVGMHFFSPANVMRLVEVVRGAASSLTALATAIAVARRLGKVPVIVGVCHGFVGNRMLRLRSVEAERLLLEGALPHEVDAALTEFGFPMGPFAMADLAGLDVSWRMRKAQGLSAPIADRLCELGRFGQKAGRGFYHYDPGSRTPQPDAEVEQLIAATAMQRGIARHATSSKDIVERLLFPMINEGARILAEGIARRPGDIDVIWVYGYGFPAWRGGPMHCADSIGLDYIRDRLTKFAVVTADERLRPALLLDKLADEGKGFASLIASR